MEIEILRPYSKDKRRSEHYYNETIITATKGNIRLDLFSEGSLVCYLPERKVDLNELDENGDWSKFNGDQATYKFWSQGYTDDDLTELSIHDMFIETNWFAWTLTDIEKNEIIAECDDILDDYDQCLEILNQFIKGEI